MKFVIAMMIAGGLQPLAYWAGPKPVPPGRADQHVVTLPVGTGPAGAAGAPPATTSPRQGTSRPAAIDLGWPTKVYPVASGVSQGQLDPSGLYLHAGRLLAVADKFDRAIFELDLGDTVATMRPYRWLNQDDVRSLRRRGILGGGNLDFEGLAGGLQPLAYRAGAKPVPPRSANQHVVTLPVGTGPAGGADLFVAAERDRRVLRVDGEGRVSVTGPEGRDLPDLPALHDRLGLRLFAPPDANAGFEGVCLLGRHLFVANERSQAAILRVDVGGEPRLAWRRFPEAHLTDLCAYRGRVFALDRLRRLILEIDPDTITIVRAYSYAKYTLLPQYQYEGLLDVVGLAEGLAIDDRRVYVLLDNNGLARRYGPRDRRALLFEFPTPAEMRERPPPAGAYRPSRAVSGYPPLFPK